MTTCQGAASLNRRAIIAFVLVLKRELWSSYVRSLGLSVGLVEHELLSIVATATRLLALHAFVPKSIQWDTIDFRLWLDVLLHESVVFNCVVSSQPKTKAFLSAIRGQYTSGGHVSDKFEHALVRFKTWFSH